MPIWIRTAARIRLKLEADIHVQSSKHDGYDDSRSRTKDN